MTNTKHSRALVSKEPELLVKIKAIKKKVFKKEEALFNAVEDFVSIQARIKDFYSKIYLPRLGNLLEKIEELKEEMMGRPPKVKKGLQPVLLGDDIDKNPEIKKELKTVYRKLARLYHPDRLRDTEEREFFNRRMSDINEAFEKGDIKSLKRYLKRADAEMGLGLSSLERIKYLEADLSVLGQMTVFYGKKMEIIKENQMYKLMNKTAVEREDVFKEREKRLKFDIALHYRILNNLEKANIDGAII